MRLWIYEDTISSKNNEQKNSIVPSIRIGIAALLLLMPTVQVQSEDTFMMIQKESIWLFLEEDIFGENIETISSREAIFKDGITKMLCDIHDINQLPIWGIRIEYYRDKGPHKWEIIEKNIVQQLQLPEKIDITPRNITTPVKSIVFHLGNRMFDISLNGGKIKNISFSSKGLKIKTTLLFSVSYDQVALPNLMYRLWITSKGAWEKKWFSWTTVRDISSPQ